LRVNIGVAPGIPSWLRRLLSGVWRKGQFIAVTSEAGMMLSKAQEIAKFLGSLQRGAVAKYWAMKIVVVDGHTLNRRLRGRG